MDVKTLNALHHSIEHWEANVEAAHAGRELNTSRFGCALCGLFFDDDCKSCPVFEKTGRRRCNGTPYVDVVEALEKDLDEEVIIAACEAEVVFLRSLLPEEPE